MPSRRPATRHLSPATLVAAALLVAAAAAPRAQQPVAEWWKHVTWLSDDALKGRAAGSEGHRKAAEYVAQQFKAQGLAPGAGNGYLQPVPLRAVTLDPASRVVVRGARERALDLKKELAVNPRGTCGVVDAPLVFVGYGLHVPELKHDDLAGQDLQGKIAVFFTGSPTSMGTAAVAAHRQGTGERWRIMRERGAVGQLAIYNPSQPGADWNRSIETAQQPTYALASGEEFAERRFSGTVHTDAAAALFEGSGQQMATLLDILKAGQALPRLPLKTQLHAELRCTSEEVPSENVVGVLEGRDAALRNEYVVLTSHLDHVGEFGTGADRIHNGAMDNASGVASLIDLARRFRELNYRPRRTVAFVAVTAEERNLLGSAYFVRNPPFPAGGRIVADINIDMFLPIIPMRSFVGFGMEESSFQQDMEAAAAAVGLKAERDPLPGQNIFIRSDQYNFVRAGIPSVMLFTGAGGDQQVFKTTLSWLETHYHRPNDDVTQPVNFDSVDTFQRAAGALVRRVAAAAQAPRWNETSVFRPAGTRQTSAVGR